MLYCKKCNDYFPIEDFQGVNKPILKTCKTCRDKTLSFLNKSFVNDNNKLQLRRCKICNELYEGRFFLKESKFSLYCNLCLIIKKLTACKTILELSKKYSTLKKCNRCETFLPIVYFTKYPYYEVKTNCIECLLSLKNYNKSFSTKYKRYKNACKVYCNSKRKCLDCIYYEKYNKIIIPPLMSVNLYHNQANKLINDIMLIDIDKGNYQQLGRIEKNYFDSLASQQDMKCKICSIKLKYMPKDKEKINFWKVDRYDIYRPHIQNNIFIKCQKC